MIRTDSEELMETFYHSCPVKFSEARELSWRKFHADVGSKENLAAMDGTKVLKKHLKNSEKCFTKLLENKYNKKVFLDLIALPSTDVWKRDYQDQNIIFKGVLV